MKMFSLRNQLQRKRGWGKLHFFLWKHVFNNCWMFVFIEKLPKQIKCIFCILKALYIKTGSWKILQTDHSEIVNTLSLSISKLATFSGLVLSLSESAICFGQHTKSSWVPHSWIPIYYFHRECFVKHQTTIYSFTMKNTNVDQSRFLQLA